MKPLSNQFMYPLRRPVLGGVSHLTIRFARASRSSVQSSLRKNAFSKASLLQNRKVVLGAAGSSVVMFACLWPSITASRVDDSRDLELLADVTLNELLSGWVAFAFCSSPTWVAVSESLYGFVSSIPLVSSVANVFVMRTFFNQFLGGQTIEDCVPKIERLRGNQVGTLLGYNIEAELDGSGKDPELIAKQTQHVIDSITAQGRLAKGFWPDSRGTGGDNRSWIRVKVTGLLPHPVALLRGSTAILRARERKGLDRDVPYPGLPHDGDWEAALHGDGVTEANREQLLGLRATLEAIASKARDENIRIVIDAEQTWYQPVIDSLTDELMQRYNTFDGPATCVASFQAYLRRYPQLLDHQIKRADEKRYKLLFKQVRGAYITTEAERWRKEGKEGPGPVWSTKDDTDKSFNDGIEKVLRTVANQIKEFGHSRLSAIFATHNSLSVDLAFQLLEAHGLAYRKEGEDKLFVSKEAAGSIAFAQLYGESNCAVNLLL